MLGNENVHLAFFNALAACGGGTVLAVVIGLAFSWIVVRTNTPAELSAIVERERAAVAAVARNPDAGQKR